MYNSGPTFVEKVNGVEAVDKVGDSGTRETEDNDRHQLMLLEHTYQADPDGCIRLLSAIIAFYRIEGDN